MSKLRWIRTAAAAVIVALSVQTDALAQSADNDIIDLRLRTQLNVFKLDELPTIENRNAIRVVSESGDFADYLADILIPRFTAASGIEVEHIVLSDAALRTTQVAALRDGISAYDVLTVDTSWAKQWATEGLTVPLAALAADYEPDGVEAFVDYLAPFYEALMEMLTYRGQLHALPYANVTMGLHFRQDLFSHPHEKARFLEEYGYPLRPPTTLPELLEVADFFTRQAGEELAGQTLDAPFHGVVLMAGENENIKDELSALLWGLGGRWMRPIRQLDGTVSGYEVEADGRIAVNALRAYLQLLTHAPTDANKSDWRAAATTFQAGRAAMWPFAYNDRWLISAQVEEEVDGAQIGIAGVPMGRPYTGARSLAVAYDSRNPEAAYWFVKYAASYEGQFAFALRGGNACRRDVVLDPLFRMAQRKPLNGALARNHDDMVRWGPQVRTVGKYTSTAAGRIYPELSRTVHLVAVGEMTPEEGLGELAEVIHRLQNQFGDAPTLE